MKTYIYKVTDGGARGYNRTITVYTVKNNKPVWLGYNDKIDTASYYGDEAEAVRLIGDICNHKHNNYKFTSTKINLWVV